LTVPAATPATYRSKSERRRVCPALAHSIGRGNAAKPTAAAIADYNAVRLRSQCRVRGNYSTSTAAAARATATTAAAADD
jgi:hypothetical protein